MGRSVEILRKNLSEHPAVRAWWASGAESCEPQTVAVFKQWKQNRKSGVYRLAGVGPGGSAVIAKRCPLSTAAVERPIYQEFLPRLPLPSLDYYGSADEPDGQSCWLFLEEAGGELYSSLNSEHRALAARWLAAVHNAGRRLDWKNRLPDRSPENYLEMLRSSRSRMREHFTNPALPADGAAVLQTICAQCDALETHWSELEEIHRRMPRTLIHGDLVMKNVRVRPSVEGLELLVFDWEFAGWGAPSTDLAQFTGRTVSPDLAVYGACLQDWPGTGDDELIQRLAMCGSFFRLLDDVGWTALGLVIGPPEFLLKPIAELKTYGQRMARAMDMMGWKTHD